jgi:uncharacterized RDD family membrane protein YckC
LNSGINCFDPEWIVQLDWHYAEIGQKLGPVTEERLLELVYAGSVRPETLIWRPGMAEWKPYSEAGPSASTPPPLNGSGAATRYCSSCGRSWPASDLAMFGDSAICAECKPAWVQRLRQGMTSTAPAHYHYAGFWIRFGAVIIDSLIVGAVEGVLFFVFFGGSMATLVADAARGGDVSAGPGAAFAAAFAASMGMFQLMGIALQVAYHSFFWVRFGGTPGQMACGLKVIRADGSPMTWGVAIGRALA